MFDLYALSIVPILIAFIGLIGYYFKARVFKTTKLNSYFVGLLSYFAIFEIVSIPSIFIHLTFNTFKLIQIAVALVLFVLALIGYIKDYKVKHINHKYRFLQRYAENKFIYQFIAIIFILFVILFLFFPFTRLRDDDLHWIINVKDNIFHNRLLQIYPENGTTYKFAEMYAFNAYTLFYSFIVSIFKVDTLAFVLITIRSVWLFTFLFSVKDLVYSFSQTKFIRISSFLILIVFTLIWTIFNNFYDMPFIIVYSSVGQRLLIILLIPLLQVMLEKFNEKVYWHDYLLFAFFAFAAIFFATSTAPIMLAFVGYFMLVFMFNKRFKKIWPLFLFCMILGIFTVITALIYSKFGPATNWLEDFMCEKYNCIHFSNHITKFTLYENWFKDVVNSYFVRFMIPIVIVVFAKKISPEFKYIAWFLILVSIGINPIIMKFTKSFLPVILVERMNYYFVFLGYILYFPALKYVLSIFNSKSDITKIFQIFMFFYLSLSCANVDLFLNRNINPFNGYAGPFYSQLDWNDDSYYPIDKYQVQALERVRGYYNDDYYVFSTAAQMINYRYRLFDPRARVITPREREHSTLNHKNAWHDCLNTNHYIGTHDLNICKESTTYYNHTIIVLFRAYNNNYRSYVEHNMKKIYENEKFLIYKYER